jgi:hypothetical protein
MQLQVQPNFGEVQGEVAKVYAGSQRDHRRSEVGSVDAQHHAKYLNFPGDDGGKVG